MGKSRIIMCLALTLVSISKDYNVIIVFSNNQLSKRDRVDFDFIFNSSNMDNRITYSSVGEKVNFNNKTVVIYDEVDYALINHYKDYSNFVKRAKAVVGLTGTPIDQRSH